MSTIQVALQPRMLPMAAAAAYCGVSITTVKRRIRQGSFPPAKQNEGIRQWDRHVIDEYLDKLPDYTPALHGNAAKKAQSANRAND